MLHRPRRFFRHEARGAASTHILVFVAAVSVTRHCRDQAGRNINSAAAMVHRVGDIEIILSIDHHSFRSMEHGSDRRLVVTVVAVPTHAGYGRDDAAAVIDTADAVTAFVDENNIAFPIHREPDDIVDAGLERGFPIVEIHGHVQSIRTDRHEPAMIVAEIDADGIAGEHDQIPCDKRLLTGLVLSRPSPGHGCDETSSGIVATDSVRLGVGDVHHIGGIEGNGSRPSEVDLDGRTISVESMLTSPDDRGDDAGLTVHFPDSVTTGIADIEIVAGIERDVERQIEAGFSTEAFVAAIAGFTDTGEIMKRAFPEIDPPDTIRPGLGKVEPGLVLVERGVMGQWNPGLDRSFSVAGASGLAVACEGFDIPGCELKLGLHMSVALVPAG